MRKEIAKQKTLNFMQKIRTNFHEAGWNTFLIVYIEICTSCIKMFNCSKVDGKWYLWYSGQYECFTMDEKGPIQAAFLFMFICLMAFPIYVYYTLRRLQNKP